MKYFCTLFDSNYLIKGVAMLRSLKSNCPDAFIYVLCMDDLARDILDDLNFQDISLLSLKDVENSALLKVKHARSLAEYCWTL